MTRWFGLGIVLVVAAACGKDKAPDAVPVQQGANPPAGATTTAATPAPAPAPRPAAPAPPADPDATELASAARVRTVQVGAFPDAETARWWVAELQRQGIPAYFTTTMVNGQEVNRLRVGAATTPDVAHALAARIQARYRWPVWITMVDDKSVLPKGVLTASRSYAAGQ